MSPPRTTSLTEPFIGKKSIGTSRSHRASSSKRPHTIRLHHLSDELPDRTGLCDGYPRKVFGGTRIKGLRCSECDECLESPLNRRRNQTSGSKEDHPCVFSLDSGRPDTGCNEDCSSAVVEFASGAHGVYSQVFYARRDAAARGATISGYLGTINFDWYANELRRVDHHSPFTATERAGKGLSHFGGDFELARDFLGVINGRTQSRTTIESGLQSVYACLAESAEKGRFIRVRQVGAS